MEAEVPGVGKDRVAVEMTKEGVLRIGVREEEKGKGNNEEKDVRRLLWELGDVKQFGERMLEMPRDASREKVSARLVDGVLRVSVGKVVEEGGRSVAIE